MIKLLKNQDNFGEPVSINYKGESTYNSLPGVMLTLIEKIFILVVATIGLTELFTFDDPKIIQVSVHFIY